MWRCKTSPQVLKNIVQHEKRNFTSPSDHVMFPLLYDHQRNTKPFGQYIKQPYSRVELSMCEDMMFLCNTWYRNYDLYQ